MWRLMLVFRSQASASWRRPLLLLLLLALVAGGAYWRFSAPGSSTATDRLAAAATSPTVESDAAPDITRATAAVSELPDAPAGSAPPMPEQSPLTAASPSGLRGFRATPEQRRADLLAYESADNLLALRDALQLRAAAGDADAAHRLGDIYDECAGVHWAAQDFASRPQSLVGHWPGSVADARDPRRQAALTLSEERCRGIIPTGDPDAATAELLRALTALRTLAEELGYPGMLPSDTTRWEVPEERNEWARSTALALLADGTPEALLGLSDSIAGDATRYSTGAWLLAACDLGYPCDMPVAYTRFWCVQSGAGCESGGRLEFARQFSTPREWRHAQAQRDEILEHLRNGRIEALMRPSQAPGGGGG